MIFEMGNLILELDVAIGPWISLTSRLLLLIGTLRATWSTEIIIKYNMMRREIAVGYQRGIYRRFDDNLLYFVRSSK